MNKKNPFLPVWRFFILKILFNIQKDHLFQLLVDVQSSINNIRLPIGANIFAVQQKV